MTTTTTKTTTTKYFHNVKVVDIFLVKDVRTPRSVLRKHHVDGQNHNTPAIHILNVIAYRKHWKIKCL